MTKKKPPRYVTPRIRVEADVWRDYAVLCRLDRLTRNEGLRQLLGTIVAGDKKAIEAARRRKRKK